MGFPNFNNESGLTVLDNWVRTRSYIDGYVLQRQIDNGVLNNTSRHSPSQADVASFETIDDAPLIEHYPNAYRWYKHIESYKSDFPLLPGDRAQLYSTYGPAEIAVAQAADEASEGEAATAHDHSNDADADGDDFFASESDQEDPEVVAMRERRLQEYREMQASKAKPAAKSLVTLDIKPHAVHISDTWLGDEVDMNELRDKVLQIAMAGLVWGSSKFIPIGYGIRKLQIHFVVEDEKVSVDELEERIIDDLPDHVQSTDVAAMQKL